MSIESIFVTATADKLAQICGRVEICVDKLAPDQIWIRHGENENAIGNLILHLAGNVRQWILGGVGGQHHIRDRDGEFTAREEFTTQELKGHLRSTVDAAVTLIRTLPPERLVEPITVQGYRVTVLEAILHVVEHFSGHAGQIIFAVKFLTGEDLGFYAHLRTKAHAEKLP